MQLYSVVIAQHRSESQGFFCHNSNTAEYICCKKTTLNIRFFKSMSSTHFFFNCIMIWLICPTMQLVCLCCCCYCTKFTTFVSFPCVLQLTWYPHLEKSYCQLYKKTWVISVTWVLVKIWWWYGDCWWNGGESVSRWRQLVLWKHFYPFWPHLAP